MTRSGCRVREADRWLDHDRVQEAAKALRLADGCLRDALAAASLLPQSVSPSRRISGNLRRIEILLVAQLTRRRGEPVAGFEDELAEAVRLLAGVRSVLGSSAMDSIDEGDRAIFEQRTAHLESVCASEDFLDDSPPGSKLS